MNIGKNLMVSVGWLLVAIAGYWLVRALRLIGMDWLNTPGALRVMALLALSVAVVVAPVVLAVLVWAGQPRAWYRKLQ